jgi:diguanylate cyclase (GGDEF)-like protein
MDARQLDEIAASPREDADLLRAVEAFIQEHRKSLRFPAWLEAVFETDTNAKHLEWLARDTIKCALAYNIFLIGDAFLVPDRLALAFVLHLLVVTPAMLAIAWFFKRNPTTLGRDLASAALPILMVAQILAVYITSRAETSPHYLYFVPMTTICTNTAMRLNYRSALWASSVIFALLVATLALTHRMPSAVALMQCISLAICANVTLNSNFDRERDVRRAYLRALRDRLRVAAMDREARHDALTGLANRRRLEEVGATIWASDGGLVSPVSIILFDADRFKSFNDRHGHPAGDACLKRIAACVTAELRGRDDLVARYGGEEFIVLMPRTLLGAAMQTAERLRQAIADLGIPHEGVESGVVTASFGVASADVSEVTFETLTALADAALYAAKRGGRDRVRGAAPPGRSIRSAVA